jgi:hypothetical protein
MAKAILEFNLDEHDDLEAHLRCVKALDMALTLWDMDQYLRSKMKYGNNDVELSNDAYEALKNAREELRESMSSRGINLDELIS